MRDNMKKVLLVAPPYMGLFGDIKKGLEDIGFYVELIIQKNFPNNPYRVIHRKSSAIQINEFEKTLLYYWKGLLDDRTEEDLYFDYLLVINGLTVHSYLFNKLKSNNNRIESYCYIYDRIKGVYQIDHNFKFYDGIYTFDRKNVEDYNLKLLPIYWVPEKDKLDVHFDIFAFGAADQIRLNIFKRIKKISDEAQLHSFIKLYHQKVDNKPLYVIKSLAKLIFQKRKSPTLKDLRSDFYTSESMSTEVFRKYINSSSVTVDTNHPYQDGLTARFMWALGNGSKIITNNSNVSKYDFYSKEQILILDNHTTDEEILAFIVSHSVIPQSIIDQVNCYRIDNWLKTILGLYDKGINE